MLALPPLFFLLSCDDETPVSRVSKRREWRGRKGDEAEVLAFPFSFFFFFLLTRP